MSVRIPILIAAPISVTRSGRIPLKPGRWKLEIGGCETASFTFNGLALTNGKILRSDEPFHLQVEIDGPRTGTAITIYAQRVED